MLFRWLALIVVASALASAQENKPPNPEQQAADLVESLGDPDVQVRNRCHRELRSLGWVVEDLLRKNILHPDAEIASRCRSLLAELKPTVGIRSLRAKIIYKHSRGPTLIVDLPWAAEFTETTNFYVFHSLGPEKGHSLAAVCKGEPLTTGLSRLKVDKHRFESICLDDDVLVKITVTSTPRTKAAQRTIQELPGLAPAPIVLHGKIALADAARGQIAIDLRARDGVRPGDHLRVSQEGRVLGYLIVSDVQNWGSWVVPGENTMATRLQKADVVEWEPE